LEFQVALHRSSVKRATRYLFQSFPHPLLPDRRLLLIGLASKPHLLPWCADTTRSSSFNRAHTRFFPNDSPCLSRWVLPVCFSSCGNSIREDLNAYLPQSIGVQISIPHYPVFFLFPRGTGMNRWISTANIRPTGFISSATLTPAYGFPVIARVPDPQMSIHLLPVQKLLLGMNCPAHNLWRIGPLMFPSF